LRAAFIRSLIESAKEDQRIFLLVGDVGYSLVEPFANLYPDRFVNVGIAEQNMMGLATGMALSGKKVFVYSLVNFPTIRCLEQIRNDVCYHNADVKIVSSGGGLSYGALGVSHHVTEDIAIMRSLPNMTVIAPADPIESALSTNAIVKDHGPCYLRLVKTGDPTVHKITPDFTIGKAIKIRNGKDVSLISTSGSVFNTLAAAEKLAEIGVEATVISMHTIKPLDGEAVLAAAKSGPIITVEEHNIIGGLGSAVAEVLAESGISNIKFMRMGISDSFCSIVGNQEYLRKAYKLTMEDIVHNTQRVLGK